MRGQGASAGMSFRVGQKAICIDDAFRVAWRKPGWFRRFRSYKSLIHNLIKNEIYTVTGLSQLRCDQSGEVFECIFVAEGRHLFGHGDTPFPAFQFCPIIEHKTDISVFTAMLTPSKQKVRA